MKAALIAGGALEEEFVLSFLKDWQADYLIGIDKGLLFLYQHGLKPDLIVGDFDSLEEGVLEHFADSVPIRRFIPEKDATDMEIGMREAMAAGADSIALLGATGLRLDHLLGNIQILMIPLKEGIHAFIQDEYNRIQLLEQKKVLEREMLFGNYVSFFPLTTTVENLCLRGFKYPLNNHRLTSDNSLGVSNEVTEPQAEIEFGEGILVMVESRD